MNKKKAIVIFFVVALLGVLTINQYLFPIYRDWCRCLNDELAFWTVCEEQCGDGDCGVNFSYSGYCDEDRCIWDVYYHCLDVNSRGQVNYEDPWGGCIDCLIW